MFILFSYALTVIGLTLFEVVTSVDNAIINAQVLRHMSQWARRWFLMWGLLIAVFLVRGMLPWFIVWLAMPQLGAWGALSATFSEDPHIKEAIAQQAPLLLIGGGVFLVLLFLNWLFLEDKEFAWQRLEGFFARRAVWFYAASSAFLTFTTWEAVTHDHPMMAFSAALGSTAFFLAHGFRRAAEKAEDELKKDGRLSDWSKIFYLEAIDTCFSIDGVIGAFAFTLSVPLILIGNGIGAAVLRKLTVRNIERLGRYRYLKNGAMYSIFILGLLMLLESFGVHVPHAVSPLCTIAIIGFFFWRSLQANWRDAAAVASGVKHA